MDFHCFGVLLDSSVYALDQVRYKADVSGFFWHSLGGWRPLRRHIRPSGRESG